MNLLARETWFPPRERSEAERRVRVWQPGGHLMRDRGAQVDDWSWRATARRVSTLARLTAPYKLRTTLAVATLLAATFTSLAPPYLAKLALDDGIREQDYGKLVL